MEGSLTIGLHTGDVTLGPGQLYVVPRGVQPCPVADGIVYTLLIEPRGTVNTGTKYNEWTYDPDGWT
jgi:mannose-6-phosphate isomerase-like protein (cupin superfamily)